METYYGHVRTPADAIILFEACRLGMLPRVQRRLSEKERQSIRSGSVFVWDEREAGMRRWTDGKSWSASRVSGSFLTYREMEGKRGGGGGGGGGGGPAFSASAAAAARNRAGKTPDSTRGSDSDLDMADDAQDGYRYKADGLMKQSFSITTSTGQHLHLISYYARSHPAAASLTQPSNDPNLRHVRPQKGMYPESTVHEPAGLAMAARGPLSGMAYANVAGGHRLSPSGATHPRSYTTPSPYAWPPSPVSTPPHHAHHHYYAPPPGPYGPPGPLMTTFTPRGGPGTSPLQYSQSITSAPLVSTTSLAVADASTAHPHLPPLRRGSGSSESGLYRPQYTPTSSPQPMSAALEQSSGTPLSKIDPRLMGLGGPTPILPPTSASRTPPPPALSMTASSSSLGPDQLHATAPTSPVGGGPNGVDCHVNGLGGGIPSIGSLVNGAGSMERVDAGSDKSISRGVSRAGSRSPGAASNGTSGTGGLPTDIPTDKVSNFGEDARALSALNRAFSA